MIKIKDIFHPGSKERERELFERALDGDAQALFLLGKRASSKGQSGFAKLFLTWSASNNYNQVKEGLLLAK